MKGQVKWSNNTVTNSPEGQASKESQNVSKALKDLEDYKGNDTIILTRLLNNVHDSNKKFAEENTLESQWFDLILASRISNETDPTKKQILADLQKKRATDLAEAAKKQEASKAAVSTATNAKTDTLATASVIDKSENLRSAKVKKEFQDIAIKLEKETDGSLTKASMVALLSDLDGAAGVEKENRWAFRQALFGGGRQKEVIGERQVYELLSGLDTWKLNALYTRLTWDSTGLNWKPQIYREGASIYDLDLKSQAKITRFQRELADQTNMMADLTEAFIGKWARTGLRAVIEGNTSELKNAVSQNPTKFLEMLKKDGILERDPAFMTKVISFLVRVGIQVPVAFFSGGMIGAYLESQEVTVNGAKWGLTLEKWVGKNGSIWASADLLGLRLNAKWNSPTERIAGLTWGVKTLISGDNLTAEAFNHGISSMTDKVVRDFMIPAGSKKDEEKENLSKEVLSMSTSYQKRANEIFTDTKLPQVKKEELITNMTLGYLSRVEAMKGTQLEWVFAAFNTVGWMAGLSGGKVDMAASFSWVAAWSSAIEAESLAKNTLTPSQLDEWLTKAKVIKNADGSYTLPASGDIPAHKIIVPAGKTLTWKIVEHVYDDGKEVEAIPSFSDKILVRDKVDAVPWRDYVAAKPGWTIEIKRENKPRATIEGLPEAKKLADFVLNLRRTKGADMAQLNTFVSSEQYDTAKRVFMNILAKVPKDPTAKSLSVLLENPKTNLQSYFDTILEKSAGGGESRAIAAKIEAGMPQNIEQYYEKNKLYKAFGDQYGITDAQVKDIIWQYRSLDKGQISTLGKHFGNWFRALVAYNQINGWNNKFIALDKVTDTNTRIIGELKTVDNAVTNKILNQFEAKLTQEDILTYKNLLPSKYKSISDADIKGMMVQGILPTIMVDDGYKITTKPIVKSYLSFGEWAQCFNLGFTLIPPVIKEPDTKEITKIDKVDGKDPEYKNPDSTLWSGTVVGISSAQHLEWGIGVGQSRGQMEEAQNPNTTQPNTPAQTSTPGASPGTPVINPTTTPVKPVVPSSGGR